MRNDWPVIPLYTRCVEVLLKKGCSLTDDELYHALKIDYGELSVRELNKTLMCLELEGIIQVFNLTKRKRRIELNDSWHGIEESLS